MRTQTEKDTILSLAPVFSLKSKKLAFWVSPQLLRMFLTTVYI